MHRREALRHEVIHDVGLLRISTRASPAALIVSGFHLWLLPHLTLVRCLIFFFFHNLLFPPIFNLFFLISILVIEMRFLLALLLPIAVVAQLPVGNPTGAILGIFAMCGSGESIK